MKQQSLIFEITQKCAGNCVYCYNVWKNNVPYPERKLSTRKIRRLLQKVIKEVNANLVTLTGGEPLIRKNLEKIVKFLKNLHVGVNIITNATLLNEKRIKKLVSQFPNQVEYKEFLSYTHMSQIYEKIDILVSTNIYGNRTLPVIETMSAKILVVVFDVLDTKRSIINKKTSFLIPPFHIKKFIQKLKLLIENPKLREKMGEEAKNLS